MNDFKNKKEPKASPFGGGFWIEIDDEFRHKRKEFFKEFFNKLGKKKGRKKVAEIRQGLLGGPSRVIPRPEDELNRKAFEDEINKIVFDAISKNPSLIIDPTKKKLQE